LRLAFVSNIAYGALPDWLRGFRLAHPDVALQLREATLDVQLAPSTPTRSTPVSCCMRPARRRRVSPPGWPGVSRW